MPTERDLLTALYDRLARAAGMGVPRYVMAEHVRYQPASGHRIADAIAIDTWGSGHHQLEGYEVKVSRSDWRRELADPAKAETWGQHCTRWYILAPKDIIPRTELPHGWGLIEWHAGRLRSTVRAAHRPTIPLPPAGIAGLMRATAQTAQLHTRRHLGQPLTDLSSLAGLP